MSRVVQLSIPTKLTAKISSEVQKLPEVISLSVQKNSSIKPKGDIVTIQVTNRNLPELMKLLEKYKIGNSPNTSVLTSSPLSIISPSRYKAIITDTSDSPWEETEQMIAKESNVTINVLLLMAIAGFIAAIGIITNAIHVVIGAMIIAPGFEPLTRISLGLVSQSRSWKKGVRDTLLAYAALILGAVTAAFILQIIGTNPESAKNSYLPSYALITYWTSLSLTAILVSSTASIAGALVLATNRSVLTAGVMIALALIPAATLIGIGLVHIDTSLITQGLIRLVVETVLVIVFSAGVFLWKRISLHKRRLLPYNVNN